MKEKVLYNIKTIVALTALASSTCGALAEGTLTWAGSSDSPSWTEAGNWRDGGGEAPSAAPMDGSAPLVFNALPQGAAPYRQVIGIGSALSVGSLTDGEPLSFRREFSYTSSSALGFLGAQTYYGFWNIGKANVQLNMASGTTLEMLQAGGALVLPNVASGTATISSLGGRAVLDKRGSGGLSVGSSAGPGAVVHVESGTVTLLGQPDGLGPAPGAVLRVDASREDTMEIEEGADGRRYISRWNDADGRDACVRKSSYTSSESWSIPYCTPPFVSPATANGLPLVDFGAAREENVGTLGPMNCAAQVVGPAGFIKNAREVFYVGWITDDRSDNAVFSGGTTYNFYRNGKTLFHSSLASTGVINGDVYLNGFRRRATYTSSAAAGDDIANLHVLSVGSCVDLSIDLMGTDRYYAGHTGGMRFGEVIIYTNNLTTAERLATHRYLMAKWMPGSTDAKFDYDAIDVKPGNSAGGTIAVPEGRTARVGQISLPSSNGLTKSGEGKLEVGALARAGATIGIQGGSVALVGVAPFGDQQPANSPALWLDATAQSSFEADGDRISKWKDCRVEKASTVYATAGTERSASKPYVIESAQNGHDVVCFGTSSSDRAYASLSGCTSAYEGFIAIKLYTDSQANVFGSSNLDFYRDSKTYLLHPTFAGNDGRAARWAVDGVVCNPIRNDTLKSDGIWHVVNFSALKSLSAGYLVIDKRASVNTGYGCCEVGEVLYYDRVLSAGERRQTEAYLMKRWLGKDHPAKAQSGELASMTFASGVPAVLDSDRDLAVVGVVADGTSLTKCGAGSVTVDNLSNADSITSISVEGGTLVTPFASTPGAAVFHFDASDARTFETNGESLVKWLDVRRNGIYAAAETPANGNASVAYPTLKTATIGGESRTYVDFGAKNEVWDDSNGAKQAEAVQATKASGMRIYNGSSSVREAHVVYADQTTGSKQHIFTSLNHYHFHRNGSQLLASWAGAETANARGGYIAIDGESCASDASLPSGFHLVSMAPSGNTAIDTIAADRLNSGRGGSRICEILAFNEALSAEARATLQGILKYKWLGVGEKPYVAKGLDSLTVKQGACYRNKDSHVSLDIASFAGGGTVDFEKATVTGTLVVGDSETESAMATFTGDLRFGAGSESADGTVLSIDLISSSAWDRVQVGGTFVQDGIVALVLNVPNRKALAYGEYPIVTAAALSDIDFSKWTVSTSDSCNLVFSLYRRNGEIGVRVEPIGFRMIVR